MTETKTDWSPQARMMRSIERFSGTPESDIAIANLAHDALEVLGIHLSQAGGAPSHGIQQIADRVKSKFA